jgi:hypothetical protein
MLKRSWGTAKTLRSEVEPKGRGVCPASDIFMAVKYLSGTLSSDSISIRHKALQRMAVHANLKQEGWGEKRKAAFLLHWYGISVFGKYSSSFTLRITTPCERCC